MTTLKLAGILVASWLVGCTGLPTADRETPCGRPASVPRPPWKSVLHLHPEPSPACGTESDETYAAWAGSSTAGPKNPVLLSTH